MNSGEEVGVDEEEEAASRGGVHKEKRGKGGGRAQNASINVINVALIRDLLPNADFEERLQARAPTPCRRRSAAACATLAP